MRKLTVLVTVAAALILQNAACGLMYVALERPTGKSGVGGVFSIDVTVHGVNGRFMSLRGLQSRP